MRIPRFTILQLLLAASLCGLVLGLGTSAWRTATHAQISHLAFSPSGQYLAAKYSGGSVQVWNVAGDRPRLAAQFAAGQFLDYDFGAIQFLDDARIVDLQNRSTLSGFESVVRMMDVHSGRSENVPVPILSYAPSFAVSAERLAIPNWSTGAVDFYHLPSGKLDRSIKLAGNPWSLAMSDDGKLLAATDQNGGVHVLDVTTGKAVNTLTGTILASSLDMGGGRLAVANWTGNPPQISVEVVDLRTKATPQKVSTNLTYVMWVALSADGSKLAISGYDAVEYYDVASGKRLTRIPFQGGDLDNDFGFFPSFAHIPGHNLALSPDGTRLASFRGGQVAVRDLPGGRVRFKITGGWRSLQILIFTVGFALWAAAWGIISRRERLRNPSPASGPFQSALQRGATRPIQPPPSLRRQLLGFVTWLAVIAVISGILTGMSSATAIQGIISAIITLVGLVAAAIALAVAYSWLVRLARGPHFLTLQRLRQITYDQGRCYSSGNLTLAFFGPSAIEADRVRHVEAVLRQAAELFGQPVDFDRPTLIACLDRQCDLDAFILRHCPIAAVVPNVWTARLALVCEETALRAVSDPADSFRAALALLLTIQKKRGLPPGWSSTVFTQQIGRSERQDSRIRAAIRRLRVRLARDPGWDPRQIFRRTANERGQLWMACDQREAGREVQAEVDLLATLGVMLLSDSGPGGRREKVIAWLRALRPKADPAAALTDHLGLTLDDLLVEWRQWLADQSGLPHDPLPQERAHAVAELHLPILRNRQLDSDARNRAVRQLGGCGYVAVAGILIDLLADPHWELRLDVIGALENLSGELFGDNPDAWSAWYKELPSDIRSFGTVPPASPAAQPLNAIIIDDAPAAELAAANCAPKPGSMPSISTSGRPLPAPHALRVCWGLMCLGGLAALSIPITMMFLIGPLLFPTVYFGLLVGVLAVARGAARDTLGLKRVATLQGACIIACDPVNLLLGAMEHNLLSRPRVQEFLLQVNGGRL